MHSLSNSEAYRSLLLSCLQWHRSPADDRLYEHLHEYRYVYRYEYHRVSIATSITHRLMAGLSANTLGAFEMRMLGRVLKPVEGKLAASSEDDSLSIKILQLNLFRFDSEAAN